jgi:hypothetical protein
MNVEHLPIYKSAMDFCLYIETIVRGFEKYHKYSIGQDLRVHSKKILFLINRSNRAEQKIPLLLELVELCEQSKMLLQLSQALKSFKSFKQFEHASKLCIAIVKQAQAWLNHYQNQTKNSARVVR